MLDGIDRLKLENKDIIKGSRVELRSMVNLEIRKTRTTDDSLEIKDLIRGLGYSGTNLDGKMRIEFQSSSISDSVIKPKGQTKGLNAFNKSIESSKSGLSINFITSHLQSGDAVYVHLGKWRPVGRDFIQYAGGNVAQVVEVIQFGEILSMLLTYDETPNIAGGVVKDWIFINPDNGDSLWVASNKCVLSNGFGKPGNIKEITLIQEVFSVGYDSTVNNSVKTQSRPMNVQIIGNPFIDWSQTGFRLPTTMSEPVRVKITNVIGEQITCFSLPNVSANDAIMLGEYITQADLGAGLFVVEIETQAGVIGYKLLKH